MLVAWMSDNIMKTWSEGLWFIQSKKNRAVRSGIKTNPYEAVFGTTQSIGLGDSPLTEDMYCSIETEEELEQLFNAGLMVERRKTRKRPTNRIEKMKMKIKPMTLQKKQLRRKTTKKFAV